MRPRSCFWCWVLRLSAEVVGLKAVTPIWPSPVSSSFPLDVILALSQLSMLTAPLNTEHFSSPDSVVARLPTLDVCGQRETLIMVGCSCQRTENSSLAPGPCPAVHPGVCQAENEVCPPPRLQYPPHADGELSSPQGNISLLLPPTGLVLILEPGWGRPSSAHTGICVLGVHALLPPTPVNEGQINMVV